MCTLVQTILEFASSLKLNISYTYFCIWLSIGQKILNEFNGLCRPSSNSKTELMTLSGSSDGVVVSSEWNSPLVSRNSLQVSLSLLQLQTIDGLSCLSGVLEGNSQVWTPSTSGLGWVCWNCCVSSHLYLTVYINLKCLINCNASTQFKRMGIYWRKRLCSVVIFYYYYYFFFSYLGLGQKFSPYEWLKIWWPDSLKDVRDFINKIHSHKQ